MVEQFFVTNAKVQLNPGSNYGLGGANHMRMNIAASRKQLEQALINVANALKSL
jgi:cystathionine beta-lyase